MTALLRSHVHIYGRLSDKVSQQMVAHQTFLTTKLGVAPIGLVQQRWARLTRDPES